MKKQTYVTLANGIRMPQVGLGTAGFKEVEELDRVISIAVELGYRHLDTAYSYGNEKAIGIVLQKLFSSGKLKREEIFITTKLNGGFHRKADVHEGLRRSLEALQLSYVDLFLIHTPMANKRTEGQTFTVVNGQLVPEDVDHLETWQGMEEVYREGKAKAIGLSNFNSKQIQRILDNAQVKPHNLQVECHAYWPQFELFNYCKQHSITLTAYGSLGSPGLSVRQIEFAERNGLPKPKEEDYPVLLQDETLKRIAEKYSKTPGQIALRWLVQRGIIVIPKSSNPTRMAENLLIFDFVLEEDDFQKLSNLPFKQRLFRNNRGMNHPEYPFNEPF